MSRIMKVWCLLGVLLFIFIGLVFQLGMSGPGPIGIDRSVQDGMQSIRSEAGTEWMKGVTKLGSTTVFAAVLLVVGGTLAFARKWNDVIALVANLSVAYVLYKGLKSIFGRPRPEIEHLVEAAGSSFPSGNALMAASFYLFAGMLLAEMVRKRKGMYISILAVAFAAVFMAGFSRVYLGVHYATDIIAGYAAGGIVCCVTVLLWDRLSGDRK